MQPSFRTIGVGGAFLVTATAAVATTRFSGGVAYIWIANAILIAELSLRPRSRWSPVVLLCGLASAGVTALAIGPAAAVPVAACNVFESVVAALLMHRFRRGGGPQFDSNQGLLVLVIAACVSCAGSAIGAGVAIGTASGTAINANCVNWFAGHTLGILAIVPLARMALSGEVGRWWRASTRAELTEAGALLGLVTVVAAVVFAQSELPLLFLPMLPVILATFRLGAIGASASIVIIAVVGGWLTLSGLGPVSLMPADAGTRVQFFQFYLAVTVMTALPVAADLLRRRRLFEELRDSEARYRLLTDNSTDVVMNLDNSGIIRFVSPSIAQHGGYDPQALIGTSGIMLVAEADRGRVMTAHRRALSAPGETVIVEYHGLMDDGGEGWFETHTRAVTDDAGTVTGSVSAIRDIGHRKTIEAALSLAAATDPLTGLANRRAFRAELEKRGEALAESGRPSCVAIFDIDHFKSVNDRFGHEVGDRVLEWFAATAKRSVRDGDLVARLGGEEFGIILSGAAPEQAQVVCDRLRQAIGTAPVRVGQHMVAVTVSAGIAAIDGSRPLEEVLRAADAALYGAKDAGRNRLQVAA